MRWVIYALAILLLGGISGACSTSQSTHEALEDSMTQQGNPFGRQVNVQRNLDNLFAPGVQARQAVGRLGAIGVVLERKPDDIAANYYIADVEVHTRFGRQTVTVLDVRFNVPVAEGDVVSLEIIGGDPRNGVFGTPIRPKGPTVIDFDGPEAGAWADDETAPEIYRGTNEQFGAYVIPFAPEGNVNTPLTSTFANTRLFTLPDELLISVVPAAAYVDVAATLHGGLTIVGGDRAGDYAIRLPTGGIYLEAYNPDLQDPSIISAAHTHHGLESARGAGPGIGNYTDQLNNPLKATGERLLFSRLVTRNPVTVGTEFELAVFANIPSRADVEWYHEVVHPQYMHPEYDHPSHPARAYTPSHPAHPAFNHPEFDHEEYSFWIWDVLSAPKAGETYYLWLGLSDVHIDIVVLGSGGS